MTQFVVSTIVEGHGDVAAMRVLLQRLDPSLLIPQPIRLPKTRIADADWLKKYVNIAVANIAELGGVGGVLILYDADSDCAVDESRARRDSLAQERRCAIECVLAVKEFESWLIAGDESFRYEGDPEVVQNAKGVLAQWYGRYKETVDQPALSAKMNLDLVRERCRSFRAFESALHRLTEAAGE